MPQTVLVTGGAGYVGSALVPKLLSAGYRVKVLDLYLYGDDVLSGVANHPDLEQVKGDIRDRPLLERVLPGCDALIHLACISNDPSFELNPDLGKSINYDAFFGLVEANFAGLTRGRSYDRISLQRCNNLRIAGFPLESKCPAEGAARLLHKARPVRSEVNTVG